VGRITFSKSGSSKRGVLIEDDRKHEGKIHHERSKTLSALLGLVELDQVGTELYSILGKQRWFWCARAGLLF
jgi:hypothetical protein